MTKIRVVIELPKGSATSLISALSTWLARYGGQVVSWRRQR
jgi:hypothetical protein